MNAPAIVSPDRIVEESGLAVDQSASLVAAFRPYWEQAVELASEAGSIDVTDATQVGAMKAARALRLKIRAVRIEAEKTRKELKEESLRRGQAIDKVYGAIRLATEPVEARLEEAEKFAERVEAKRKADLAMSRAALLGPYGVDTRFVNLAEMPDSAFQAMLEQARTAHEAKIERERKEAEERERKEIERRAEEERIRIENARLRAEAEAKEAEARKEREAMEDRAAAERAEAEKKLKAEREAREKIERENAARAAAEARAKVEAEAAARRAAAAPDSDKLRAYADAIEAVQCSDMATHGAHVARETFVRRVAELAASIRAEADRLRK